MPHFAEGLMANDHDPDAAAIDAALRNVTPLPLALTRLRQRTPPEIEPRPWLYGTILQRKYVSLLVAPGGTGKSQLALGIGIDLVTGRKLLGPHVFERVPTWFLSLEDDAVEIERRVAAFRIVHNIPWADLDNFYVHSGRERRVCMAKLDQEENKIVFPDKEAVLAAVRSGKVGLIIVDPFVRSHELDENSNPAMDAAVRAWTEIAEEENCAILLVHHVRKAVSVGIEAARGAKALSDAARVGLLLTAMTEEEAEEMGIDTDEARRFVRLDNSKANMAPAGTATWFQMTERNLGNKTKLYPAGDTVSAIIPWNRPKTFEGISDVQCNLALDAIEAGIRPGVRYCAHRRGRDNSRWAGAVVVTHLDVADARADIIIGLWLKSGLLTERPYRDAEQRKDRTGLFVDNAKRPSGAAPIA
jgi:hypothetical protein